MKKEKRNRIFTALFLLAAFALWTVLVRIVDLQAIGPRGSSVGFATFNGAFHRFTGVHMLLYHVTDWLGLVPVAVAFAFAVTGLCQWIKRKNILRVDRNILALGVFYIAVIAFYLFFEECVVNYRPVLIDGYLEASYPSSTTLLVACVMPTAWMQLPFYCKKRRLRRLLSALIWVFVAFMVIGRLVSGVHWLSDIIGGALLSTSLVTFYGETREDSKKVF